MIVDILENGARYAALHPQLLPSLIAVQKLVTLEAQDGKYELDGGAYAVLQSYETNENVPTEYENHRAYIDIQLLSEGLERILCGTPAEQTRPYDATSDVEFFTVEEEKLQDVALTAGVFCVLFPGDAHAPGLSYTDSVPVRKIVIKLPV